MNYEELKRAKELVEKIREIDDYLKTTRYNLGKIRLGVDVYVIYFGNKYKEKCEDIIKEIRAELIEELKELGVTEEFEND